MRGRLQTEFADIPAVEAGAGAETKRGHLALDYTCMKWVQLSGKVSEPHVELLQLVMLGCALITCLFFFLAEEEEGRKLTACAWNRQWGCTSPRCCCWTVEVEGQRLPPWVSWDVYLLIS